MIVTVLVVVAFVGVPWARPGQRVHPGPHGRLRDVGEGRRGPTAKLAVYVPDPLPARAGEATSASYATGDAAGLAPRAADRGPQATSASRRRGELDPTSSTSTSTRTRRRATTSRSTAATWQTWTRRGRRLRRGRCLKGPDGTPESVLVVGHAPRRPRSATWPRRSATAEVALAAPRRRRGPRRAVPGHPRATRWQTLASSSPRSHRASDSARLVPPCSSVRTTSISWSRASS